MNPTQKRIVFDHMFKQTASLHSVRDLCHDVCTETLWNQGGGPVSPARAGPASFGITGPYPVRDPDSPSVSEVKSLAPTPQASVKGDIDLTNDGAANSGHPAGIIMGALHRLLPAASMPRRDSLQIQTDRA